MPEGIKGRLYRRGNPDYEEARLATVWNGRVPERYPELIVQAAGEEDVGVAVGKAAQEGMTIGIRSGGHSWSANHLRDSGMLLDLSALRQVTIDSDAGLATVQPGRLGSELGAMLAERDLFFPGGHCPSVAVGGYLLQGGFGWNGRVHGPACASVEAIDVVTAAGEVIRADEEQNSDLLWAARGAGPGFFAAVTRFHLRLHQPPAVIANSLYIYPLELLDEVFTWADQIGPSVPRNVELMLLVDRDPEGEVEIAVTGPVLADSEEEARDAVAILRTCPVRDRAKLALEYVPAEMADLYAGADVAYPRGHRYVADNMWTGAPAAELLPGLRRIAETLPEAPSHMLWMNWGPSPPRPDMAYSVEDETYIAVYGVWRDPQLDAVNVSWAAERMREMEHLATGIQLADENLGARPARFVSDRNLARLQSLRRRFDPAGRFHSWMGLPGEGASR